MPEGKEERRKEEEEEVLSARKEEGRKAHLSASLFSLEDGEGEEAKFNLAEGGEKEERGGCTLHRERGDAIDLRGRYFA